MKAIHTRTTRMREGDTISELRETGSQRRLRVLVVDDSVDVALSLAMMVQAWGHQAATAHDGLEAVMISESYRPHVVILDLLMPRMDGYEVARYFRESSGQTVTLIALTAYGLTENRMRAIEAGFDHHTVKPPNLNHLRELLSSA